MSNLNNLVVQEARPLPVIILADVSGSMQADNKIGVLNGAIREMIDSLKGEGSLRAEVHFAVITFGGDGALSHLEFTKASNTSWTNLSAAGRTPMGDAFVKVKDLVENKDIIPGRSYAPTIVLLSDGIPTDEWQQPLKDLLSSPRAAKAFRIAMSIGAEENGKKVLEKFLDDSELDVFEANQARDIKKFFKFVTMSVSQRAQSVNPNQVVSVNFDDNEEDLDDFEF